MSHYTPDQLELVLTNIERDTEDWEKTAPPLLDEEIADPAWPVSAQSTEVAASISAPGDLEPEAFVATHADARGCPFAFVRALRLYMRVVALKVPPMIGEEKEKMLVALRRYERTMERVVWRAMLELEVVERYHVAFCRRRLGLDGEEEGEVREWGAVEGQGGEAWRKIDRELLWEKIHEVEAKRSA
ncbi:hypothetical protein GLOTRDRAFT_89612 [Gloeophyllum trabeum ATCC 11539]|uniref:Uncharacterized protein n=1 Tax=Gloeophyllum trabeum (strain ATCC 11539 / FP-39264 / Madison 617) TaxID=670483 RepID=S7QJS9_GLOTA|nr:uncharacterized protein GLOTRDRAFT_89612 [Gloeophyllum trabeum ATCC 11539]EPQ59961.1 hypothetical protein GLOTRDRAFT_89612 [Gloeophyllum trabeum ATCC 11539]